MGLISSGPIADFALFALCEEGFLLCPNVRAQYNIRGYVRFKDDLFFVLGGNSSDRAAFYAALQQHAYFFRLKVDAISKSIVEISDLLVYKRQ